MSTVTYGTVPPEDPSHTFPQSPILRYLACVVPEITLLISIVGQFELPVSTSFRILKC